MGLCACMAIADHLAILFQINKRAFRDDECLRCLEFLHFLCYIRFCLLCVCACEFCVEEMSFDSLNNIFIAFEICVCVKFHVERMKGSLPFKRTKKKTSTTREIVVKCFQFIATI